MDELPPTSAGVFSSLFTFHDIPHYYGDFVRQLFVATAALAAVAIPVWGDLLPIGTALQVAAIIALVMLAGLTNPHGRLVMIYNATVATLGVFLLEVTAITYYSSQPFTLFAVREVAAILLLFAMYFSIKTMRAMSLGKLGKRDMPIGFEEAQGNSTQERE